jgi:hypothetical protein
MSIKADLVFDQRDGGLVGFVNSNGSAIPDDAQLASHVLVFYVAGINNDLNMSMGFFPTKNVTADDMYHKMWNAIFYLEVICGLKVLFLNQEIFMLVMNFVTFR